MHLSSCTKIGKSLFSWRQSRSVQECENTCITLQAISEGEREQLASAREQAGENGSHSPNSLGESTEHKAIRTNGVNYSENGSKVAAPDVVGSNGVHFRSGSYQPTSPQEIAER